MSRPAPRVNASPQAPEQAARAAKAGEGRSTRAPQTPPAPGRDTKARPRGRAPQTTRKDVTLTPATSAAGGAKAEEELSNRAPKTRPASGRDPAAGAETTLPPSAPAGGTAAPYGRDPSGKALSINKTRAYSIIPARADWTREQRKAALWAVDRVLDGRSHDLDDYMPRLAGRQQGRDPEVKRELLEALAALGLVPDADQPEGGARP
ncbi:hypothetical protein [Streptomyces synnematoformans]|uniref:Uncharacterized protein n=1 Tax=Streptomyces synnematoformans TaxID=415721 RepID=A0ABN2X962_9ACTN